MFKKIKYLMVLASLSVSISFMSNTYSRYVDDTSSNMDIEFAVWQILVNNEDITDNNTSDITFTPTIEPNVNVTDNVVAPTSKGYFDIKVNPANVDVSFDYTISLNIDNQEIPDLIANKYAILDHYYVEGDAITTHPINSNLITESLLLDDTVEDFAFDPFTIRVYFEWYDEVDNNMNDETDTQVSETINAEGRTFKLNASINFSQKL